jgi:D-alanyl-lipoteichoic acid acyltransferase DltB (MBOAT superfamily)
MLFNSLDFLIFLVTLLAVLLLFKQNNQQKWIYLIASYIFYMWWNPVLIILLLFSTTANYFLGELIYRQPSASKGWFITSVVLNLGLLGFFKYANFFEENLVSLYHVLGYEPSWTMQKIVLPVGISFYTFQALSYVTDIYRKQITPARSAIDFFVYKAFFPQLVAGPIVRASDFLPQLQRERKIVFEKTTLLLIVKGLFKKVVIADNLGHFTDAIYKDPSAFPSLIIWVAAICFTIQIYCDFSGYTDMAIGIARLLGFHFPENFNNPYTALTPSDFWKRWHMSLSGWLKDYLYIPLGGNRKGRLLTYRNIMITMLLGGLWHGAAWNFILWGGLHGALLCLYRVFRLDERISRTTNKLLRLTSWAVTFFLTMILWIIFRVNDTGKLKIVLTRFFVFDRKLNLGSMGLGNLYFFSTLALIGIFTVFHLYSCKKGNLETQWPRLPNPVLVTVLFLTGLALYYCMPVQEIPFIYFQF